MIDWSKTAKVAGGGYGTTIFVLIILALAAWLMSAIIQKYQARHKESDKKG